MASTSFTAVGSGSQELVRSGSTIAYALSGTFVATLQLVYSTTGGNTWTIAKELTAASSGNYILETKDGSPALVMWRCTARTSGTAATSFSHDFMGDDDELLVHSAEHAAIGVGLGAPPSRGVVLFGDSITANCGGPNYFNTSLIPTNPATGQPGIVSCLSWFHLANAKLGNPWKLLANLGIGGSTVTAAVDGNTAHEYYPMVNRWRDALKFKVDTVFWGPSGINDIKSNGQSGPDRVIGDMQTILTGFLSAGMRVIKIGVLPMSTGSAGLTGTASDVAVSVRAQRLARKEKELFTSFSNVIYIDAFKLFADPTSRYMLGDATLYYDGLHPNNKGAWLIANAIYSYFNGKVLPNDDRANSKNDSYFGTRKNVSSIVISNGVGTVTGFSNPNLYPKDKVIFAGNTAPVALTGPYEVLTSAGSVFTFACPGLADSAGVTGVTYYAASSQFYENPLFQQNVGDVLDPQGVGIAAAATSGTVTGTVPAGTGITAPTNCSIVSSLVARADGRGNNLHCVITTTAAVSNILINTVATQYAAVMSGTYKAQVGLLVTSANVGYDLFITGTLSDSAGESQTVYALNKTTNCTWDTQDWTSELLFDTDNKDPITPSGSGNRVNSQSWVVRVDMSAAGTLTLDIGLPSLIKTS